MIRTLSITAVAAFAGIAHAQTVGVTIEIDEPILAPGEFTDVRLVAHFPDADYAFAGVLLDFAFDSPIADPRRHWSNVIVPSPFGTGPSGPQVTESAFVGLQASQLHFPPAGIFGDPSNPITFFEATFTAPDDAGGGYVVDLSTLTDRFDVYLSRDTSTAESRLDLVVEDSASIFVIPAPASAVVLALGVLGIRRRR